jgi:hypothetical protein
VQTELGFAPVTHFSSEFGFVMKAEDREERGQQQYPLHDRTGSLNAGCDTKRSALDHCNELG